MKHLSKYLHKPGYNNFKIYTHIFYMTVFAVFLQVLGSSHEYHFIHYALPHARSKRSVPHIRKLKADKRVRGTVFPYDFVLAASFYLVLRGLHFFTCHLPNLMGRRHNICRPRAATVV